MITRTVSGLKKRCGIATVVLSGGVFQNRYLTAKVTSTLRADGFKVYAHSGVSTTDAGIPLGQIAIAQARLTCV
jgi:hydrogenase maturation protein HypF